MKHCILHRQIGIDLGHRIPDHGSKCKNPHGHRYSIVATCQGPVIDEAGNEENGMIVDFGNVKKYMMDFLDSVFDHGFVISRNDTALMNVFFPDDDHDEVLNRYRAIWARQCNDYCYKLCCWNRLPDEEKVVEPIILPRTLHSEQDPEGMKIIVVDYVPTAENLAKHMYTLLGQPIKSHYRNDVKLVNLRLYETPNGWVDWPGSIYAD